VIVNHWLLFISVVLLWFPRPWMRKGTKATSSRSRKKKRTVIGDNDLIGQAKEELFKPRNWVDFFRALAGGLAVSYLCFDQAADAATTADTRVFLFQILIYGGAVLIQTVRLGQGGLSFVAPVFFLLGLSFGLLDWKAAVFVTVAGFCLNRLLPGPGTYLFVFAILELVFGGLLPDSSFEFVLLAVGLAMAPVILSGVSKSPLVWLNKSQTKPM
jgi:hypothetical protein